MVRDRPWGCPNPHPCARHRGHDRCALHTFARRASPACRRPHFSASTPAGLRAVKVSNGCRVASARRTARPDARRGLRRGSGRRAAVRKRRVRADARVSARGPAGHPVFDLVHPDDRDATRQQAARLMDGRGQRHFRNRYLHRDGHAVDLLWSAQWLPAYGVRVGVARDVSELRRVEQELEDLANHDMLTGLPNRRRLHELLVRAVADAADRATPLAVLYIDLDGFKAINDVHGHPAGDRVLTEAARRFQAGLRQGDTVARIGGDEFMALLPGCDTAGARAVADAMRAHLRRPIVLEGVPLALVASIGIAAFPADARDPESLIACADRAMYAAKRERARLADAPVDLA
ncbi:diguanylate cyclase domain-containing protein [Lysobacter humi (ex Lee et al. 2017)]